MIKAIVIGGALVIGSLFLFANEVGKYCQELNPYQPEEEDE